MLKKWIELFQNKNIAIWGYGKEGKSSYQFIHRLLPEQKLTIIDLPHTEVFKNPPENTIVKTIDEVILSDYEYILKSPGIVLKPEQKLETITSQSELFMKMYRSQVIGVTGTKGKSTTSSLIYHLLKQEREVVLLGNIGKPCFEGIDDMEEGNLAVIELSCHQLEYTEVSPHIAIFLNLYEEHLDHYGSFVNYALAKANIYLYQEEGDLAIVNSNLPSFLPKPKKAWLIGQNIYTQDNIFHTPLHNMPIPKTHLIGHHNELNMAVAVSVAQYIGINEKNIKHGLESFCPLEHRLEYVGLYNGLHYVNDSISTIGQSCIQAISSLPLVQTVLIGGMDRGIEYHELEDFIHQHDDLNYIFMYATGKRILKELGVTKSNYFYTPTLKEAVKKAQSITDKGRMILLSPAAASYDAFKNFEDRGRQFKEMVKHNVE